MNRAYLTRNTDRVRVTGTPSPGSVAPASFINTVDRVNPSTWSRFPVSVVPTILQLCQYIYYSSTLFDAHKATSKVCKPSLGSIPCQGLQVVGRRSEV